jgi:TolB-like protein/class 3 adenylate cyclase/Tfp pilus assembly protein PilF
MPPVRRLTAILAADVAGYSRLMGADEEGTHERFRGHLRELIEPKIAQHRGRIVKNTGDGFLAEFASVVDAVRCAVEMQRGMAEGEPDVPNEKRIRFRIGINLGDVIVEEHDIFGDGVNVAARLEALAEPGGICVSRVVRDQVRDRLDYMFEDMGEQQVKNIARPVRVYALRREAMADPPASRGPLAGPILLPIVAPRLSIVVLPFANLSDDREQQYFADGITDDLTTDLSRMSGSFVIARNTAFTYKGKPVDVKRLGRELGVRYVLEGSVRRTGHQVRVNVQLVDAETGAHLWADRFDTDRITLPEAQDAMVGRIARTLNGELLEDAGRRIERERMADPDARDLVMYGRALFNRPHSVASFQEAQRAYEQALEKDPGLVDAKIGIASVLLSNIANAWSPLTRQDLGRAEQLLLDAIEQNANNAWARSMMGLLHRLQDRAEQSLSEWETAIALDRNNIFALRQFGVTLMHLGRPEEAIPLIEKGVRLSPYDAGVPGVYQVLGLCHLLLGHVETAIELFRKSLAGNTRLYYTHMSLAAALGLQGDLVEARVALAQALRLRPDINSIAQLRTSIPYSNPQYLGLLENVVIAGLRKAGVPEE